jgi:pyridoxal phosphate enzyme (YggS family)
MIRKFFFQDLKTLLDKKKVVLVAVSKNQQLADIKALYKLGQRDFGENRVQELVQKAQDFAPKDIRWHMIGHVQSNKLKALITVPNLASIQSVDSEKLLDLLIKHEFAGDIYFEYKTSVEKEKAGFSTFGDLKKAHQKACAHDLKVKGLMTMAPIRTSNQSAAASESFCELKKIRDKLDPKLLLSMGMSNDYAEALSEGSNMVRIGSLLFDNSEEK